MTAGCLEIPSNGRSPTPVRRTRSRALRTALARPVQTGREGFRVPRRRMAIRPVRKKALDNMDNYMHYIWHALYTDASSGPIVESIIKGVVMKKTAAVLGIVLLTAALPGFAQIDYVANGGIFYSFENEPYAWTAFDCVSPALSIFEKTENPLKEGINLSDSCGSFITTTCTWEGTYCDARFMPIDFSQSTTIKVKVFAPEAGRNFMVKLEDFDNNTNNPIEISPLAPTATANEWEEMEFDCSAAQSDFYTRVVLFPDFTATNDSEIWFFDDVRLDLPGNAVENRTRAPESFLVASNYPNPFNPSTTIDFQLPRSLSVDLRVYGPTGSEAAVLVDGVLQAGRHRVVFDGSGMPSGMYVYRLRAGVEEVSGKMILNK